MQAQPQIPEVTKDSVERALAFVYNNAEMILTLKNITEVMNTAYSLQSGREGTSRVNLDKITPETVAIMKSLGFAEALSVDEGEDLTQAINYFIVNRPNREDFETVELRNPSSEMILSTFFSIFLHNYMKFLKAGAELGDLEQAGLTNAPVALANAAVRKLISNIWYMSSFDYDGTKFDDGGYITAEYSRHVEQQFEKMEQVLENLVAEFVSMDPDLAGLDWAYDLRAMWTSQLNENAAEVYFKEEFFRDPEKVGFQAKSIDFYTLRTNEEVMKIEDLGVDDIVYLERPNGEIVMYVLQYKTTNASFDEPQDVKVEKDEAEALEKVRRLIGNEVTSTRDSFSQQDVDRETRRKEAAVYKLANFEDALHEAGLSDLLEYKGKRVSKIESRLVLVPQRYKFVQLKNRP